MKPPPLKTGDECDVQQKGGTGWVRCRVDLASANHMSIAVSAAEGLPLGGIDRFTARQMLLLAWTQDAYKDIVTGHVFEVRIA